MNFDVFWLFWKFSKARPSMEHWAKLFFSEKMPQNMFKASFDKIGNDFRHFWIFEKFGIFRIFSKTPWNTGQKKIFKKIGPKHVQNTFEYFCERFWAFLDFWNFSKTRPSMEHWGKNFFRRKMLQNTFGHLRTILDSFRTLKPSWFFSWIFSKYLPRILSPENRFQIVLVQKTEHIFLSSGIWTHNFESRKSEMEMRTLTVALMQKNDCWVLCRKTELMFISPENWTHFFEFRDSELISSSPEDLKCPAGNTGQKIFRKYCSNASSKDVWTISGTILGTFGILKLFWFFLDIFESPVLHGTRGKLFFFEKIVTKHVQNKFGQFWKRFWAFLQFWVFFNFWKFSKTPQNTGQKNFFKKIAPKHVQNTFEYFCELFWAILDFWKFSKTRTSLEHWGKIFFWKKCPKTRFDTWERFWTVLEIWKLLDFFLEFFLSIYLEF